MQARFKPYHFKFRCATVKDSNQGRLSIIGPPGVCEVIDVVDRILCLTFDGHRLVFLHVPRVLGVHGNRSIDVDHLHVDAVRLNVGEFDIKGCGCRSTVIIGADGGEGLPALVDGGSGAHTRVVAFLAICPRPINIDHSGPNFLRVRVVRVSVECDWVFHFGFRSLTSDFDLRSTVFHGHVENQNGFIPFLVLNGDFNRIHAVVNPGVIEKAGWGNDPFVGPCTCSIIERHVELTGHFSTVFVKAFTGVEKNGFSSKACGL